jgi:hypothetical protein
MRTIALNALLASAVSLGAPSMRVGARLTTFDPQVFTYWKDSSGEYLRVTHEDPYSGLGIEAVYGPVWWLYGRLDLAELRFFRYGGGELALVPEAGLDLLVEPQLRWRLLPYVWGGVTWSGYWGSQGTPDTRFDGLPLYKLRAGLGLGYRLSRALNPYAEVQLVDGFRVKMITEALPWSPWFALEVNGIGFARANLGIRYDFGAK